MRGPYRTIEDVLRSPWAAIERPEEGSGTDRVLRSTRLEDSIYADLRDGDDALEQTEGDAAKKLPSFPALARDVFQSFYSLMPRKNGEDMLTVAARKFNEGFRPDELALFNEFLRHNAHLLYRYAAQGGIHCA